MTSILTFNTRLLFPRCIHRKCQAVSHLRGVLFCETAVLIVAATGDAESLERRRCWQPDNTLCLVQDCCKLPRIFAAYYALPSRHIVSSTPPPPPPDGSISTRSIHWTNSHCLFFTLYEERINCKQITEHWGCPQSALFTQLRYGEPLRCRCLQEPHGLTSQKTTFFIVTAVKTSSLT
jgi:hypothetical protein